MSACSYLNCNRLDSLELFWRFCCPTCRSEGGFIPNWQRTDSMWDSIPGDQEEGEHGTSIHIVQVMHASSNVAVEPTKQGESGVVLVRLGEGHSSPAGDDHRALDRPPALRGADVRRAQREDRCSGSPAAQAQDNPAHSLAEAKIARGNAPIGARAGEPNARRLPIGASRALRGQVAAARPTEAATEAAAAGLQRAAAARELNAAHTLLALARRALSNTPEAPRTTTRARVAGACAAAA